MKHLRKFNEGVNQVLDVEYIKLCFADLLDGSCHKEYCTCDNNKCRIKLVEVTETVSYVSVIIDLKKTTLSSSHGDTIDKLIQNSNYNNKILQEVEVALNRINDEFPDCKVSFDSHSGDILFISIR
jgi:hypothetical protein